ncbi:hypothetical protein [uncultured Paludibaculum sp.]|uniref:hypothetical protein n=1 Tax=uncultured Paludibaculum sp. TaxID=1765020 RepID=UPI002AAA9D6C|nr:hypothetical protein [uncultured Paludibaculum sp.]
MPPRRTAPAAASAASVSTHDTILNAIRILLDASSKTTSDPAGAKASVGAALRLLLPIVAPGSLGPDDTSGSTLPNKRSSG